MRVICRRAADTGRDAVGCAGAGALRYADHYGQTELGMVVNNPFGQKGYADR